MRVLRGQNGKVGVSHTITTIIKDNPKRFNIVVENEASFFSRRNREYYFDPNESLGIGTQSGPGFGKTVTFASPGVGATNLFIPAQQVFLPNHGLATGDGSFIRLMEEILLELRLLVARLQWRWAKTLEFMLLICPVTLSVYHQFQLD